MTSHFFFGIETTTPVPKKFGNGTSSMKAVPGTTWPGASMCVPECITVVIFCVSTPDLDML